MNSTLELRIAEQVEWARKAKSAVQAISGHVHSQLGENTPDFIDLKRDTLFKEIDDYLESTIRVMRKERKNG